MLAPRPSKPKLDSPLKMEVLFQIAFYIGAGVSLTSGSISGLAYTIKAYTQVQEVLLGVC